MPDGLKVYFNPFDGATIEENNDRIARGWIPMFVKVNTYVKPKRRINNA